MGGKARRIILLPAVLLFSSCLVTLTAYSNPNDITPSQAAAECISGTNKCPDDIAERSGVCAPRTFFYQQEEECRMMACEFCKQNWAEGHNFCVRSWTINNRCREIMPWFSVTPNPSPTISISSTASTSVSTSASPSESESASASCTPSPMASMSPSPSPSTIESSSNSPDVSIASPPSPSAASPPSSSPTPSSWSSLSPSSSTSPSPSPSSSTSSSPSSSSSSSPSSSTSPSPSSSTSSSLSPSPAMSLVIDARAAAECVSANKKCSADMASRSGICKPDIYVSQQDDICREEGCGYCRKAENQMENICKDSWAIRHLCRDIYPSVSPLSGPQENLRYNALCVSRGNSCPAGTAELSVGCKMETYVAKQSKQCIDGACMFCANPGNQHLALCRENWAIKIYCYESPRPSPSLSDTADKSMPTPTPGCTWFADEDKLVIPMSGVTPTGYWSKYDNGAGYEGLQWRAGDNRMKVDSPGLGKICFRTAFNVPGTYYLTALTAAPHGTEHNDMWIYFNGGLKIFHAATMVQLTQPWATPLNTYKAYQNFGNNRIADIISTVNHNPHIFVTDWVAKDTAYQLCIDGRSSKFRVFELVMVRCSGDTCKRNSNHIRDIMADIILKGHVSESSC